MKISELALVIVLSGVTAFAAASFVGPRAAAPAHKETAFERVMRTGVLRCGYYVFAPATIRDPTSGALSGYSVDMMEAIGKSAGLKIEWAEETDFGNWTAGLAAGRFDAMCTFMWPAPTLARVALFTRPILYSSINVYAREDDHRFDGALERLNSPDVTIVTYDNDPTTTLAHDYFPKAHIVSLPASTPSGSAAQDVVTKKADVTLWDENGAFEFQKTNPHALRNIDPARPLKVMPSELLTRIDEPQLRDFLDVGVQELQDTGVLDRLIDKWKQTPTSFLRVARPYAVSGT